MPRKALKTISPNVVAPPSQEGKPADTQSLQKVTKENEELKAQIAMLSAQLEQAKLDTSTVEKKEEPRTNPFGGLCSLPAPKTFIPAFVAPVLNHPKRPETAFQCFCKDNRTSVSEDMQDATVQQVNAKLAEMWKACDEESQAEYHEKVKEDHERYEKELSAFNDRKKQAEFEQKAVQNLKEEMKKEEAMKLYEAYIENEANKGGKGQAGSSAMTTRPEAPKNARSAYHFYLADSHKKGKTTTTEVADQWKKLQSSRAKASKATIEKYNKMAHEDQERHAKEVEEYKQQMEDDAKTKEQEQEAFKKRAIEIYKEKLQSEQNAASFKKLQVEKEQAAKLERKKEREEKKAAKAARADEPKRPKNAYTIYFAEHASAVAEKLRNSNETGTTAGIIGAQWRSLGPREKKKYEQAADKDRLRYKKEMEVYNAKKEVEADEE